MSETQGAVVRGRDLKYVSLADRLRGDITAGRWAVSGRLPTERELATTHGVAMNTVRRAVSLLCHEGLLRRSQGSGTFVRPRPVDEGGKSRLVGVLVPSTTYYFPRVLAGIEQALSVQDVRMMLACAGYDPAEELRQASRLVAAGAQGLLLVPTLHLGGDPSTHLASLAALGVPQVLVERIPPCPRPDDDTEYVATDHLAGAYSAVRHLSALGHRRIAYLGRSDTASAAPVTSGFSRAVADGLATSSPDIQQAAEQWPPAALDAFIQDCRRAAATAVVCLGDREATGLIAAARRAGVRVPRDLAVVTYDDEVAELAEVPLTAIAPPKEELGRLAAQLLLRRLRLGPSAARHQVRVKPSLIVRASCGAPNRAITELTSVPIDPSLSRSSS